MFWKARSTLLEPTLLVLGIATVILQPACAHRSLSIQEAKQVTVSIHKTSLVPPPHRVYDVVDLLRRDDRSDNRQTRAFLKEARAPTPVGRSDAQLANFFLKRGQSAQQLGLMRQARDDLRRAYRLAVGSGLVTHDFKFHLASVESPYGNYRIVGQLMAMSARESGYLARPRYSDYLQPRPIGIAAVQRLLRPGETLLAIHTTLRRTFIWAIPCTGGPRMRVVPADRAEITALVTRIRHSLDATPATLGDIPAFDLASAHRLYRLLLAPLSDTWEKCRELLAITNAPLDRLPLGVFPIGFAENGPPPAGLLFANYRQVDWLIRHVALSRHASVTAFAALRQASRPTRDRRPFAGFGDPLFALEPMTTTAGKSRLPADLGIRERGRPVKLRSVRVTAGGPLDEESLQSTRLEDLAPLPDTAEEIQSIAQALQAAPQESVFLGAEASEARVKTMDLSDRQVIAFATHALLAGDLDGLTQPALALSSPEVTGEAEDGLLTMGEIMTLDLDADWVLLSACDTGSGDQAGSEALSGLGAAFFYAGSRALLASLWPVETSSARQLTTGIFARQQAHSEMPRAQALQASMLDLMDGPGLIDPASGKVAASYAHPLFWAPFIVVGEGAAADRH